jgi:hypothetical protein
MTDDDAKRNLSDEQRKLYDEAVRESFKFRAMMGVGTKDLIGILRELATKTAALERIANPPWGDTPFDAEDLARAALAPPPTEGNPA